MAPIYMGLLSVFILFHQIESLICGVYEIYLVDLVIYFIGVVYRRDGTHFPCSKNHFDSLDSFFSLQDRERERVRFQSQKRRVEREFYSLSSR